VRAFIFTFFSAAACSSLLCGCSTDEGTASDPDADGSGVGGGGSDGSSCLVDYTNYEPQSAALTLASDILPIFARSCALSTSCHRTGTPYHLSLGPGVVNGEVVATDVVLAEISTALGMPSVEVPTWRRVSPGEPERSYLMRKLEGTQRCGDLACVVVLGSPEPCGGRMPGGDSALPLEPDELGKIRDWIEQGVH